jgi:DDE family transposase
MRAQIRSGPLTLPGIEHGQGKRWITLLLSDRRVAFSNHRGTCDQYIKEGKGAVKWTRLSCRSFAANAVRLQLHALAYN